MVSDSWLPSFLKFTRNQDGSSEKALIGVIAFEVSSLMSKLVHLWHALSDKQIAKLRQEINDSIGIKNLVSEDEEFIGGLICMEMMENMENVAKSVARLAKKCSDPRLNSFMTVFSELTKIGADPYGWEFSRKNMHDKVKKMERFITLNASLYQEMEILADLEQNVKRMKSCNAEPEGLVEFQKKIIRKQRDLKNLRDISIWGRSFDYTVLLLARSLFTIFSRIKNVFGISQSTDYGDSRVMDSDYAHRSHSVSAFMQSSVHPSETSRPRFLSGPFGRFTGPTTKTTKTSDLSQPSTAQPSIGKKNLFQIYSGPLKRLVGKSGSIARTNQTDKKMWWSLDIPPILKGKKLNSKSNALSRPQAGAFKGCMMSTDGISPDAKNLPEGNIVNSIQSVLKKRTLLDAPPDTLGAAGLALHYANIIILIEKLAASPHLVGDDARDDLYNMLTSSLKMGLREKLKPYAKGFDSWVCDEGLAEEWSVALARSLDWLAPLAHHMIRWQSERNHEQQSFVSRTNVVLIQTLYFANQEKIESTIIELLVGLNYVWRFERELNAKA